MSTRTTLITLDPAAAHPEVRTLQMAVDRRDWAACRAQIDAAPPAARTALIGLASDRGEIEGMLRDALQADPDDGAAAAVLGSHLTKVGWEIRSSARAKDVSRDQFASFHEWLRRAERVLVDGAARNPRDPAIWTARLTTARGLQLGQSEARRRYDRLAAVDPHHEPGQSQFLQQILPKWGGTWEGAHGFARDEMRSSPPGSHSAALVADAHLEHWLDLEDGADLTYLRSPAVLEELYEAGKHSVWHPAFQRTQGWVTVMNTFAMVFSLAGDHRAAGTLFTALGHLGSTWPWQYLGDPQTVIAERRDMALGGAR